MSGRAFAELATFFLLATIGAAGTASGWVRDTSFKPSPVGVEIAATHDIVQILEANAFEIEKAAADHARPDETGEGRYVVQVIVDTVASPRTGGRDFAPFMFDVYMAYGWHMTRFGPHVAPTPQPDPRDGP